MTYDQVVALIGSPIHAERYVPDPERILTSEPTNDVQHQYVVLTYSRHVNWASHAMVYVNLKEGRLLSVSVKMYGPLVSGGDSIYMAPGPTGDGIFLGPDDVAAERAFRGALP
jgi:hypothetical protein